MPRRGGPQREVVGRVSAVINPAGRLTALISIVAAGLLVSTVLRGIHLNVHSIAFGPVDTVLTGTGLLAIAGGLYARKSLRGASPLAGGDPHQIVLPGSPFTPSAGYTGRDVHNILRRPVRPMTPCDASAGMRGRM